MMNFFSPLAQDNSSVVIEVKIRPSHAQWRYRLDVLADGKRVYFDRPALKMQHFKGRNHSKLTQERGHLTVQKVHFHTEIYRYYETTIQHSFSVVGMFYKVE